MVSHWGGTLSKRNSHQILWHCAEKRRQCVRFSLNVSHTSRENHEKIACCCDILCSQKRCLQPDTAVRCGKLLHTAPNKELSWKSDHCWAINKFIIFLIIHVCCCSRIFSKSQRKRFPAPNATRRAIARSRSTTTTSATRSSRSRSSTLTTLRRGRMSSCVWTLPSRRRLSRAKCRHMRRFHGGTASKHCYRCHTLTNLSR